MATEMDTTAIIVLAVVGSAGLLGAILGFVAEAMNPSIASVGLGVGASIFLLGGQITVTVIGGCFGACCKKSGSKVASENQRIVGILCGVFSWISATAALVLFLGVSIYAAGTFVSGGVLTLVATALCITSFIMLRGQPPAGADAAARVVPATGAPIGVSTGEQQA